MCQFEVGEGQADWIPPEVDNEVVELSGPRVSRTQARRSARPTRRPVGVAREGATHSGVMWMPTRLTVGPTQDWPPTSTIAGASNRLWSGGAPKQTLNWPCKPCDQTIGR